MSVQCMSYLQEKPYCLNQGRSVPQFTEKGYQNLCEDCGGYQKLINDVNIFVCQNLPLGDKTVHEKKIIIKTSAFSYQQKKRKKNGN